jgi:hypothetical protein
MKLYYQSTLIFTVIGTLLLSSCSTTGLSISLTVVSDACAAAAVTIPLLEGAGLVPPGIGNIILAYTGAVSDAASQSATELLSTDTALIQSEKIIGYFAAVAVPALGPTIGPEVAAIVKAIEAAVNLFIAQFKSPMVQSAIKHGTLNGVKLGTGDRRALGSLKSKFQATSAKCKTLMKP